MGKGFIQMSRELAQVLLYLPEGSTITGCEWYEDQSINEEVEGKKCLRIYVEHDALPEEENEEPYHYNIPIGIGYHTWRPQLGHWVLSEDSKEQPLNSSD